MLTITQPHDVSQFKVVCRKNGFLAVSGSSLERRTLSKDIEYFLFMLFPCRRLSLCGYCRTGCFYLRLWLLLLCGSQQRTFCEKFTDNVTVCIGINRQSLVTKKLVTFFDGINETYGIVTVILHENMVDDCMNVGNAADVDKVVEQVKL